MTPLRLGITPTAYKRRCSSTYVPPSTETTPFVNVLRGWGGKTGCGEDQKPFVHMRYIYTTPQKNSIHIYIYHTSACVTLHGVLLEHQHLRAERPARASLAPNPHPSQFYDTVCNASTTSTSTPHPAPTYPYPSLNARHFAQPTPPSSPNTPRRFALGARNICLVGENPMCSVPASYGCEGLWSYDYGYA